MYDLIGYQNPGAHQNKLSKGYNYLFSVVVTQFRLNNHHRAQSWKPKDNLRKQERKQKQKNKEMGGRHISRIIPNLWVLFAQMFQLRDREHTFLVFHFYLRDSFPQAIPLTKNACAKDTMPASTNQHSLLSRWFTRTKGCIHTSIRWDLGGRLIRQTLLGIDVCPYRLLPIISRFLVRRYCTSWKLLEGAKYSRL